MRSKFIMGNWKMHGNCLQIANLLHAFVDYKPNYPHVSCVVLPPAIYLQQVKDSLQFSAWAWGAQNVFPKDFGAVTGELSGPMLNEFGCRYVLVGHSERRRLFHEDEKFVAEKFHHVKEHGMIPVLCVGETLTEREQGLTEHVLTKQILAVTQAASDNVFDQCIIAYEPVWAIGTGQTAEAEQVQAVHTFIRKLVSDFGQKTAAQLPILYGGSMNEKNARGLLAMPDVDGGLIGGASLHPEQFLEIIKCIN